MSRINPPDTTRTHQTTEIEVHMLLRDDNGDDEWFGKVAYQLIFLGRQ